MTITRTVDYGREPFGAFDFSKGRVFDTCDVGEAQTQCSLALAPHRLTVEGDSALFRARMACAAFGPLSLYQLDWNARVTVDAGMLEHDYLMAFPVEGAIDCRHGDEKIVASPGQAVLAGGGQRFHFTATSNYRQVIVHFKRAALDGAWAAMTGAESGKSIRFACDMPADSPARNAVLPLLHLLLRGAGDERVCVNPSYAYERIQDALLTALLLGQPHSLQRRLTPQQGLDRARVRRAQDFMHENLSEPLTLTAIASALGIPSRTLQQAFQSAEGMGPMQWLRGQRLQAARTALARGDAGSVADAALRFGFFHLGEFSHHYRRAFGESPRDTFNRGA